MRVRLEGVSKKGKERIMQHGSIYEVKQIDPTCKLCAGKIAYYVESLSETLKMGTQRVKDGRWVAIKNDPDFKVELLTTQGE
jgi:hypothetical protein